MAANPGRNSHVPRTPAAWQATVGALIDNKAIVHACCSRCNLWRPANLQAIADMMGRDYSLWDRRPRCSTPGCNAAIFFHASIAEGTPSRPMRSF